jgi:hypothetical protein
MSVSLREMKLIPAELLTERIETVKALQETEHESYDVVKDRETGEHYLHYAYLHVNFQQGGQEEIFHHLLPLSTDDVLAVIFGDEDFAYPGGWKKTFLRNGPDGCYVWFDPLVQADSDQGEMLGERIQRLLSEFQQGRSLDDDSMRELFAKLDKMLEDKPKDK